MADSRARKRPKKIREDSNHEKPTKDEIAVAKHLRFQLPTKKTTFMQENVEYFTGSKAVDFLLDSKWATSKKGTDALFTTRGSVVAFMNRLMQKRMFYRTIKTVKRKRDKESKNKDKEIKEKDSKETEKETKDKEKNSKSKEKEMKKKDKESDDKKSKKQEKKKEEDKDKQEENESNEKDAKKGKKKVILDFADQQTFKDNLDAYVWVYDPIKPTHYMLGFFLVIAAIGICIYPLWPPEIKIGTYYLSLVGAGLVGSILVLGVFRFILFTFLWIATFGKLHFWLVPNLLEDVGVRESFEPLYTKEWRGKDKKEDQNDKDKEDNEDNKKEVEDTETQEENDDEKAVDSKNEDEKSESATEGSNVDEGEENADFEVIEKDEISAVEE